MPLFKTIRVNKTTKVLIWKIEESLETLSKGITLTDKNKNRVNNMKSKLHQRGFLSIRHLLKEVGYVDADLVYDNYGKPHLKDGKHISITHSYNFSGIIIANNVPVGIDIEKQREKIIKIAKKFTPIKEYNTVTNYKNLVRKLTIVWGAKESLYKIYGKKKLRFLDHIFIDDFSFDEKKTRAKIKYSNLTTLFDAYFLEFEGFTCVYAL